MSQPLADDWRKAIEPTPRSRVHLWINDRSQQGWPIQGFARPVCNMVLKHRNTDPVDLARISPDELCRKCQAWHNAHPGHI
jgi:hypothetical protein